MAFLLYFISLFVQLGRVYFIFFFPLWTYWLNYISFFYFLIVGNYVISNVVAKVWNAVEKVWKCVKNAQIGYRSASNIETEKNGTKYLKGIFLWHTILFVKYLIILSQTCYQNVNNQLKEFLHLIILGISVMNKSILQMVKVETNEYKLETFIVLFFVTQPLAQCE